MIKISKQLLLAKLKAGLIHFVISLTIFGMVLAWVWFVAYPDVYFSMAGAVQGLTLVFLVDVVLGPVLSFLVYNPKKPKKEIISDFAIIGAVQLGALVYGVHTLYQEQPKAVVVYQKSSATVFSQRELSEADLAIDNSYSTWRGLPVAVYSPNVSREKPYQTLGNSLDVVRETDKATRLSLNDEDKAILAELEKVHGNLYVIAVLAKYNGAYFALNPQLEVVTKFGEKPMS